MKQYLKTVAKAQEFLVNKLKGKKEPSSLSKIAGANLPGNGKISFSDYGKIIDNINGHTKEWRRFKNDPNKIVIEKNFLMNCLNLGYDKNFFLFRTCDDEGLTFIDIPKDFFRLKPTEPNDMSFPNSMMQILILFLSIIAGIMGSSYFFFCLLIIPIWLFLERRNWKKIQKKKVEWKQMYENQPNLLLYNQPYSFPKDRRVSGYRSGTKTKLNISFNENVNRMAYEKTLNALTVDAHQMKGKIAWLWFYSKSVSNELSSVSYDDKNIEITLGFNLKNYYLIPAIETEYSFIFSLEHFSSGELMDKYEYAHNETAYFIDTILLDTEKGTVGMSEEMFSPVE